MLSTRPFPVRLKLCMTLPHRGAGSGAGLSMPACTVRMPCPPLPAPHAPLPPGTFHVASWFGRLIMGKSCLDLPPAPLGFQSSASQGQQQAALGGGRSIRDAQAFALASDEEGLAFIQ